MVENTKNESGQTNDNTAININENAHNKYDSEIIKKHMQSIINEQSKSNNYSITKSHPCKVKNLQHNRLQSDHNKPLLQNKYNIEVHSDSQTVPNSIMKNYKNVQGMQEQHTNVINTSKDCLPIETNIFNNEFSDQSSKNIFSGNNSIAFINDLHNLNSSSTHTSITGSNNLNTKNNNPVESNVLPISLAESTSIPTTFSNQKPKVRFNLDINYEKEREWNRVNKIIGDASKSQVEWTQEVEV